jgi:hypothetical protein
MKKKRFFLVLQFFGILFVSEAQQATITYFDDEWNEVKAPKTAKYYREAFERNDTTFAKDFFISGALQMTGSFLDKAAK